MWTILTGADSARSRTLLERLRGLALTADSRLTRRRVRRYAFIILIVTLAGYLAGLAAGDYPFDTFGHPVAVDLSNRVTGGRIALQGDLSRLYNIPYQHQIQQGLLGPNHPDYLNIYVSPPFVAYAY